MPAKTLMSDQLVDAVCHAMDIPTDRYQRMIIDCTLGYPVRIYFQFLGDTRLIGLDLDALLKGAEITDLVKAL
jgi:hypothetical protein